MRRATCFVLGAGGTFAACLPLCAVANQNAAPVSIVYCKPSFQAATTVKQQMNPHGTYSTTSTTTVGGGPKLIIAFRSDQRQPIRHVRIAFVEGATMLQAVEDSGTFTKGAVVRQAFPLAPGVSPLGISAARCDVLEVTYADGSRWTREAPR